ncbi:MAG: hypothetical protein PHS41_01465 [Victivallaceae bacterium]|nr:hypothetical protein [Victivallaceae bacterium]
MFLKLCGITDESDLEAALAAEPAAVGFQVGQRFAGHDFILPSTAARLAAALPPFVTGVLVTHFDNAGTIAEAVGRSGIATVQCSKLAVEEARKLRDLFGESFKLIDCCHAQGLRTAGKLDIERCREFNAVNLDWFHPSVETREKNGEYLTELAGELIGKCSTRMVLSGAITPEWIPAAAAAGAWAVDVSEYIHEGEGESRHVSREKCLALRRALNELCVDK